MEYYTEYTLTVRKLRDKTQFEDLTEELKKRDIINYAICDGEYYEKHSEGTFYSCEEVKWYNHSKDMVMISEKFPNVYFELAGNGEEFGDFWKEYYHDGECEYCRGEIIYEQPKTVQWNDLLVNF